MNRLVKFAILASALLTSQITNATLPSGKLTGWIDLHKGTDYSCELEIDIKGNSADFTIQPSNTLCIFLMHTNTTYNVTYSGNNITFHNVEFITMGEGGCYGDLTGEWDGTELFFDTVIPAKIYGADCRFGGYLS